MKVLEKWCKTAARDGIKVWYDSQKNPVQFVFWTLVMTTLMGASAWFIYRTVIGYIDCPCVKNVEAVLYNKTS